MSSNRIGTLGILVGLGVGLTACQGVVMPGRTAGETWGGAYSAQFAKKEEPKKEEKKEEKKDEGKAKASAPAVEPGTYDRPGFITRQQDGRIWAFRAGSKDLTSFLKGGEPTKSATLIGMGPGGLTVRAPDVETAEAYAFARPGFEVWVKESRIWAFKAGSKDAASFGKGEEPAKNATLIGVGPDGRTVRGPDLETIEAYVAAVDR